LEHCLEYLKKEKCVAYPQEEFLFTIRYMKSWRPPKKYIQYLKIEKEPANPMKATQQICRLNPKSKNPKSTNQNQKLLKKTVFRTLKVEKSQKFVWGLPDEICRLDQKFKKIIETSNQPIRTKIFLQKMYF
jgi:hypothetical protein